MTHEEIEPQDDIESEIPALNPSYVSSRLLSLSPKQVNDLILRLYAAALKWFGKKADPDTIRECIGRAFEKALSGKRRYTAYYIYMEQDCSVIEVLFQFLIGIARSELSHKYERGGSRQRATRYVYRSRPNLSPLEQLALRDEINKCSSICKDIPIAQDIIDAMELGVLKPKAIAEELRLPIHTIYKTLQRMRVRLRDVS